MKLLGTPLSPFVRKVLFVLEENEITYESDPSVSPMSITEKYKEKYHPLGKIPALEDGDFCLADSSVIISYLNDKFLDKNIYPKDIQQKAKAQWFEEYCDTKVMSELTGVIFYQRVVVVKLLKQECDEELVNQAIENSAPPIFDYLNSILKKSKYLVGDEYSTADMALLCQIIALSYAEFNVDSMQWPELAAYIEDLKSIASVQKVLAAEMQVLAELM
ncbi:MAG: glutathione S-transferase [Candidatus Cloacimonadota bacterium]|nr:MAG: glutathione S-transferase [Candidatus Cloacimonadota bacterium]